MQSRVTSYFNVLGELAHKTQVTDREGRSVAFSDAVEAATKLVRDTHNNGNKVMFIGNGGSAGIASHMATDYLKNGGIRACCFNDGAALTCLGNDLGYENVFAKQIDMHARAGDTLFAISSSGKSPNILKAVEVASERGCTVITLSGFGADNPLRTFGDFNYYVPNGEYGFVEITHLALIHSILDLEMGWGKQAGADTPVVVASKIAA